MFSFLWIFLIIPQFREKNNRNGGFAFYRVRDIMAMISRMKGGPIMFANYHTHTWRCRHANGTERQYIDQALAAGVRILGFSDHAPCPFPGDYYSDYRMFLDQTEEYFATLTALKREYAGQLELHIGVEAEYYPALFEGMLELLRQYPCEYMLLGQHFLENEDTGEYVYLPSSDPGALRRYVDQTLAGLRTGLFTCLAHPDLFRWTGDREAYVREMTRLCRETKKLDTVLEYNLLGHWDRRTYPNPAFWEIAAREGNRVILGVDAHSPQALNRPDPEREAREFLSGLGITPLERLELVPICAG